jgi:AcrR family transcriptional regulator
MSATRPAKVGRPVDRSLPQRRREEILAAATTFFARHGYQNADIELLAEEIGIGKGTIYRYFPTKDRLFRSALQRGLDALHATIAAEKRAHLAQDQDDHLGAICRAVIAYFTYFDQHPEIIELMVMERAEFSGRGKPTYFAHRDKYLGGFQQRLRTMMAKGEIRTMEVDTITSCLGMVMYGALVTHPFMAGRGGLAAQARRVLDVVLDGIRAKPRGQRTRRAGP